jgi:aspartate/methionine/tyrosine aminotransferase
MEDGFTIKAAPIIDAITPKTKAILVNSPCNPTGALITESEMAAIADAAKARGIWVIVDFTYEKLIYEPVPHNLIKVLFDRMRDRTIICSAASKAYAMTGWRCGWAIGPKEAIGQCNVVQGHSTSNINSLTQKAAIAALTGPQDGVTAMLNEYRKRRDAVHGWLTADPRIVCVKPGGALSVLPVPLHRRSAVAGRPEEQRRVRRSTAEGGGGRGHARGRFRLARLFPPVLRDVDRASEGRLRPHQGVRAEARVVRKTYRRPLGDVGEKL